jgi:hypothetical protein
VVSKPTDLDHTYENEVYKHGRRRTDLEKIGIYRSLDGSTPVEFGGGTDNTTIGIVAASAMYDRC